jgi:nucleolar pre-ribosomal-associated protein 1
MEIYRRANVFERACSFYESPGSGLPVRRKILHLLYRSTQVRGSTTLITRAGIVSWIQSQVPSLSDKEAPTFAAMAHSLYESSEQDRVVKWSGGTAVQVIENIVG